MMRVAGVGDGSVGNSKGTSKPTRTASRGGVQVMVLDHRASGLSVALKLRGHLKTSVVTRDEK